MQKNNNDTLLAENLIMQTNISNDYRKCLITVPHACNESFLKIQLIAIT